MPELSSPLIYTSIFGNWERKKKKRVKMRQQNMMICEG
jgi:hypothetical protein